MPPEKPDDNGNGRITLAVIQNDIKHLVSITERGFADAKEERCELHGLINDHEIRLRTLEGGHATLTERMSLQGRLLSAAVAIAGALGIAIK